MASFLLLRAFILIAQYLFQCNGFLCSDGIIVDSNFRCDGEIDCMAGEDEKDCGNSTNRTFTASAVPIAEKVRIFSAEADEPKKGLPMTVIEETFDGDFLTGIDNCYVSKSRTGGSAKFRINYAQVQTVALLDRNESSFLSKTLTGTVIEVCLNSYSCSVCGEVLGAQRGQWVFVACRKETQAMIANEVSVHNDRVSLGFCEVEVYGKANHNELCSSNGTTCSELATCNKRSDSTYHCVCIDGFGGDGYSCSDIDECSSATGGHSCDATTENCFNVVGSFECECREGYTRLANENDLECSNINECEQQHICQDDATCVDSQGSYSCICNVGFVAMGDVCEDLDECQTDACDKTNEKCLNTVGSFECHCAAGFRRNSAQSRCTDVDECSLGTFCLGSHERCVDTEGSYYCSCVTGFKFSNGACRDINECSIHGQCNPLETCENTVGSYKCKLFGLLG